MHRIAFVALFALAFALPAHAARESLLRKGPHYTGKPPAGIQRVVRPDIAVGRTLGEPGNAGDLLDFAARLLPDFEAHLASLLPDGRLAGAHAALGAAAPPVYAGSPGGFYAPDDRPAPPDEPAPPRDAFLVYVPDAPGKWKKELAAAAAEAGASHVLIVTLELSDYPVAQKNWKGGKAVELGTGHMLPVPWLTSLDQPVEVLAWTGALYRADGKLVRAGAEGFHALRTPFMESALRLQRTMTTDSMMEAIGVTRADLPGEPLAWQAALTALVRQLTGRAAECATTWPRTKTPC